ncbi:RNA recognition motif domain-containing protein [Rhizoctonia solani AG-1 IA]|uniref:RNA recognition motif domain-containing protein n=1 Tax=Thanatephorus cucumeris (strain AG1-IA) TaxID=983506 RepID=L8X9B8_THACA|nr:RNA recognition motif domain-containing protein [Rhizoctonia solani AG-1 IA]
MQRPPISSALWPSFIRLSWGFSRNLPPGGSGTTYYRLNSNCHHIPPPITCQRISASQTQPRPTKMMQNGPNRMGLGLRAPMPNYQPIPTAAAASPTGPMHKATTLFVGSISPGISDGFLTSLFACGPLRSFKRLQTPQGKPQAFGFAEFEEPDAVSRALQLLDGRLLPSLEGGQPKKLSDDEVAKMTSETLIGSLIAALTDPSALPQEQTPEKSNEVIIPPHLQDLQEQDLPEEQRGLVLSEISLFRERSARRDKPPQVVARQPQRQESGGGTRTWGQPQQDKEKGESHGLASKPIGFVQATRDKEKEKQEPASKTPGEPEKTDEEREKERLEARRRDEDNSFQRRYEPRERQRIAAIERALQRERGLARAEEKDRQELKQRLAEWDDDASDEPFYVDRARWRQTRHRFLLSETQADDASRAMEERQAEHLRLESEAFLARQMDEMRALAEEQRKAGLLLDDGAPVRLAISAVEKKEKEEEEEKKAVVAKPALVFGQEEDEEIAGRRRRGNLVKLDFEAAERERVVERLHRARDSVPKVQDALWRAKVKWDSTVQKKIVPLARKKLEEYLGELDDDDMVVFIADHVRSRKGPVELVEALEPVLVEEATDLVVALWRQVVFESAAYGDGLESGDNFVDQSGDMVPT